MPPKKGKKGGKGAAAEEDAAAKAAAQPVVQSQTPLTPLTVRVKYRRWTFFIQTTNKETTMHIKVKLLNQVNPARQPALTTTTPSAMGGQSQLWPSNVDGIKLMVPKCRRVPSTGESTTSVNAAATAAGQLIVTSMTGARSGTKYAECVPMELDKTLEELQIQHDDILFCLFAKDATGQKWDDGVDVPAFEPLGQEELQQQLRDGQ